MHVGQNVLIVEDDTEWRRIFEQIVASRGPGITVRVASDFACAEQLIRETKFDGAFVDIHLPGFYRLPSAERSTGRTARHRRYRLRIETDQHPYSSRPVAGTNLLKSGTWMLMRDFKTSSIVTLRWLHFWAGEAVDVYISPLWMNFALP